MEYQTLSPNIGVESVDESVKFYTDILGFNLAMRNPETGEMNWAMVVNGDVSIMFQEINCLKEEYPQLEKRSLSAALTLYIHMKNMGELYQRIKGTKYLAVDLHQTFYGANEFALFDNNGYILTISEK